MRRPTHGAAYSANLLLKGIAAIVLYGLLGHPSVYVTFWERRDWYILCLGVVVVPLLISWSIQVLVWRVRIEPSSIEIISPRGFFRREFADVVEIDRVPGRVALAFKDGTRRTIPSFVGNLDKIAGEIASRRSK